MKRLGKELIPKQIPSKWLTFPYWVTLYFQMGLFYKGAMRPDYAFLLSLAVAMVLGRFVLRKTDMTVL